VGADPNLKSQFEIIKNVVRATLINWRLLRERERESKRGICFLFLHREQREHCCFLLIIRLSCPTNSSLFHSLPLLFSPQVAESGAGEERDLLALIRFCQREVGISNFNDCLMVNGGGMSNWNNRERKKE
jgi:hypothetical protein